MSAVLYTQHYVQFFDNDGNPLSGGKLYTYEAGTTTAKATYTTSAGTTEHSNPVILDAYGRNAIFLQGSYKFTLKTSSDVLVYETDNVTAFTTTGESENAFYESFSGDGTETEFTLSDDLGTDEKLIMVFVDAGAGKGFDIQPTSAYTVDGTTLTFGSAPATGTNNIQVWAPSKLAGSAAASADSASTSASAAATSASNASDSETLAEKWANEDEDVIVSGGEYSAKHYSIKSSDSSTSASTYASNASDSADAAAASAIEAAASAASASVGNLHALTSGTITSSDEIAFADVDDSNIGKKDTVQGILDLVLGNESTVNAIGSIGGGTQDIDLSLGRTVTATVDTSTTTFTFSNPQASGKSDAFDLILTNGGSQTINYPASVDWAGGTAPTLTASGVDHLVFTTTDGGTTWYGYVAGLDIK